MWPLNFKHFVLPYLLHEYPQESHGYLHNGSVAGVHGYLSGVTRSFRKLCDICCLFGSLKVHGFILAQGMGKLLIWFAKAV